MTEALIPDPTTIPRCTTTASFTLAPDGSPGAPGRIVTVQCVEPTGHTGDHTMIDPNTVTPTKVARALADDDLVEWLSGQISLDDDQPMTAALTRVIQLHAARGAHECPADGTAGVHVDFVTDCLTLRLLASAYADRPGYLPEWRP